ncbi:glycine C-acetyltransferase [Rhizobium sp. PP-CC-2G-626]|nr:glycine C-acetyltransferase [Rhizobium sp. PP-CC-2G-626]
MDQITGSGFHFGMASDHLDAKNVNLVERWLPVGEWFHARGRYGLDPYQKSFDGRIAPRVSGSLRDGTGFSGVNFASQDYLSLASHPALVDAAIFAAENYGVHSAGSAALMGITSVSKELEQRLESYLQYREVTLFPTGWTAGFGIVKMLARPGDHILVDVLAHACLQEGAQASRAKVHRFPHLSYEGVKRRLLSIRKDEPSAGILVITETLFSMDSDTPDLTALQALCRQHNATLLVDCAHDLGCMGPNGLGILADQDLVGKVDVLIGTFSKTFASTGGFVATQHTSFRTALRACCGPQTFTNAMTPLQANVILAALSIVQGKEGNDRRARMASNALKLRSALTAEKFAVLGNPSAIVPVIVGGSSQARRLTNAMISKGAIVNLVEAPAVAKNQSRWRLQVMADHDDDAIKTFVKIAVDARMSS